MNRTPIVPDGPLLVSIILPTLNRSHCLGKAVGSVLAQSYPNWELILSNNGRDPVSVFNPRARVIDSSAVTSAAYARNLAIGSATGDLVCFLDDDDELDPDYLATFVELFAERPELRLAKCLMTRRGVVNETYGTPTVVLRRGLATATWEPITRQDRAYFAAIIARENLSEEAGTLALIPRVLVTSGVDPVGGLRSGNL
jgi:glycosyltransferase involved in cell wall biosynthesis